ncbi:coth protein-domain-containing protein [Radiomyces spectabilis]|uniref:coth protein-domain-containing protein n=1 Tax=Radiomyces spectabilis TaxID=64574 RepID=UPI00221E55FF|nr:coth protein-domain-containing protein [Radiomyces spectabilis]KAI8377398.1 coth protein-domain-containing protein [Radiomyces spectabilis]
MKLWAITSLIGVALSGAMAADVQYAVVAFPQGQQTVAVSVGGKNYPLQKSQVSANLFQGSAPAGETYQYVLTDGQNNQAETAQRKLIQGATSTGNEFFNRSQTLYNVPDLPQAYHPIYPPLFTGMNKSNEIATLILQVNASAFDAILKAPKEKHEDAEVTQMTYISHSEVYSYTGAGISNSGQSTKDFAKQSFAIKLGKFKNSTEKDLLFGRTTVKLRAEETDQTLAREKLTLDCLLAAGGASLSGSWTRVFVNNEPLGLFLLMDDASTHFIDNALHGGNWSYPYTGVTYKGNALSPEEEGNLVYLGDSPAAYPEDLYKLEDKGEDKTVSKNDSTGPLIDFIRQLSYIDPKLAKDAQNQGNISNLIDPTHTLIHMSINFLVASWDGFWYQASNYYLNQDLQSKKWALITYDFDETFGNGAEEGMNTVSYQNYTRPGAKRPLVDVFLQSPYYKAEFEKITQTIVKRFFNPRVMNPRLEAWSKMLKEDIEWTRALPGRSPGTKTTWTVENFLTNMNTTDGGTIGLADWVKSRTASITQQLNFNDADDLPALGPYTGGNRMDATGKVTDSKGNNVTPSGSPSDKGSTQNSKDAGNAASSLLPSFGCATIIAALVMMLI